MLKGGTVSGPYETKDGLKKYIFNSEGRSKPSEINIWAGSMAEALEAAEEIKKTRWSEFVERSGREIDELSRKEKIEERLSLSTALKRSVEDYFEHEVPPDLTITITVESNEVVVSFDN